MIDVLLLEDDPVTGYSLARLLEQRGFQCHIAGTVTEAKALLVNRRARSALLDLMLPDGRGDELIPILLAGNPSCRVVVCSGADPEPVRLEGLGACAVIAKPVVDWDGLLTELRGPKAMPKAVVA